MAKKPAAAVAAPLPKRGRMKFSLAGNSDAALAVGVVAILMVMIIPVPPGLLDIFLALNITMGVVVLLTAIYTLKPLDFSIFPATPAA